MAVTSTKFIQTADDNPSWVINRSGGQITDIQAVVQGVTYTATLTYTAGEVTAISAWVSS